MTGPAWADVAEPPPVIGAGVPAPRQDSDGKPVPVAGGRPAITRELVLVAALQVIEDGGLGAFSIRRVADRFGVATMAMYYYIHGRDDLLDASAEHIVNQLYLEAGRTVDAETWQHCLIHVAQHVREVALAHPQLVPLILNRRTPAPWLRPPLASLAWLESLMNTLCRNGFTGQAAIATYRTFCRFLTGHLLDIARTAAATSARPPVNPPITDIDIDSYPHVHALRAQLPDNHAGDEFDHSLATLIDQLAVPVSWPPT